MLVKINEKHLFTWLFVGLIATEVALVLLDAFVNEYEWASIGAARRFVNITREDGLPNFFSSVQLLAVGAVLILVTIIVRNQSRSLRSRTSIGWGVIAGLFVYLGIDDGTKLHERAGSVFKALVTDSSGQPDSGLLGGLYGLYPSYTWQLLLGPFFAAMGVFIILFLLKELPSLHLKILTLVAISLFGLAVGLDFIEGMSTDPLDQIAAILSMDPSRLVHFSKSIEEFMEMVATTTFLFVFLKKLTSLTPSITFELDPGHLSNG